MKSNKLYILLLVLLHVSAINIQAQIRKSQNQPYGDQKLYHLGFALGIHGQDMILSHTGFTSPTGEAWFAVIPSYSVGFNIGIVGDRYLNEHFNVRLAPTLLFGEKHFIFKEQITGTEYSTILRGSYLSFPLLFKYNAGRINNYRPYLLSGGFVNMDISPRKDEALRFKSIDYGLEFGLGCNIYFPLFKLCPEIKFSLGLRDLINHDNSDLTNPNLLPYREAIKSGKTRIISLIFNFE